MTKGEDLAFPFKNPANDEGHSGLTKREWMATTIASQSLRLAKESNLNSIYSELAKECVKIADALIAELNKDPK